MARLNQFRGAAIVMGVAGCGKTTVGEKLAIELGVRFVEGDLLHPLANVAKMTAGIPLDDDDRWPWLDAVGAALQPNGRDDPGIVASCSALKLSYRQRLAAAGRPIYFIFLDGDFDLLSVRLRSRQGHFMPESLLASQFAALERPTLSERSFRIDSALPLDEIVRRAAAYLCAATYPGNR